ncbi:MAG TPA: ammonia-forming cytochrome c nitrite reductase subunit c552, partial [Lacipirellulaceae bacterium]|nr:ammonia-forming cytochrome c nitrite reductase subunit c552 [Lacipirellulaceae bacterium]
MKIVRVGAILLWLAFSLQYALGQEKAQTSPAADSQPAGGPSAAAAATILPPPVKGSRIPHDKIGCAACHTEPLLWEGAQKKFYVPQETLEHDVHWQKGVACSDCHGGDPTSTKYADAHAGLVPISRVRDRCGLCHKEEKLNLIMGVHAKAGDKDERGRGQPLDCSKCHGSNPHEILAVNDKNSPVRWGNQVRTCGACHAEGEQTYAVTAHGKGLFEAGLKLTAVCADCHGSHGIFFAADRRSTLNPANVAKTCSKCHQSIEGRLQNSVHGRNVATATAKQLESAATRIKNQPVCTDCHLGHPALAASQGQFRLPLVDESCGNCHAAMYSRYARNVHSVLTDQGFAPAAKCSDCHGSHSTLAVNDPKSRLAVGENRLRTCQQCHA